MSFIFYERVDGVFVIFNFFNSSSGIFALPALLFKSMVELQFDEVTWSLVLAICLGKVSVFIIVFVIALLIGGGAMARAGLYAIFATQSNDFAMGYPISELTFEYL